MIDEITSNRNNECEEKWNALTTVSSDNMKFNDILNHKITPHIAVYNLKEL